jgi:hypothetical protein
MWRIPAAEREPAGCVRRSLIDVLNLSIDLAIAASLDEMRVQLGSTMCVRLIRRRATCRRRLWREKCGFTKKRKMQLHKGEKNAAS